MGIQYELLPSVDMELAISEVVKFARNEFLAQLPQDQKMMAMWSTPEYERHISENQAKLGGAGLGIVALSQLYKLDPNPEILEEMKAMGNFIVFMQKDNGSFYSKYIPGKGGRNDEFHSLYYPGEAILGLITLYEYDKSGQWLATAIQGIRYLANLRKDQQEVPGDHWALIASKQLLKSQRIREDSELKKLIINHAIQICKSLMTEQVTDTNKPDIYGAYSYVGATTSSSTALEGLIASLHFIPREMDIHHEIELSVNICIDFLLRAQIKEGVYSGAFQYAIGFYTGKRKDVKAFNKLKTSVRIDYVQHALSALIQYYHYKYPTTS
jgi:hypothetical protein